MAELIINPMDSTTPPHLYKALFPDNPWYPLPKDYPQLTVDGQMEARISALRSQDTPLEFVASWDLFRRLYLMTTEPGFFYHNFCESPPFHYELIQFAAQYARNLIAAPRGFSKSTIVGIELILLLALTRPYLRIAMGLATDKLVEGRFDVLMEQLECNPNIVRDFGILRPKRGSGIWNRHRLALTNGVKIEGFSVTGRKRGARPDMFILDDPENDPDTESGAVIMRDKFETFLFKQVIPMLEKGSGIYWIGTIIGRRSYLAHACYGDDTRFQYWNRRVYAAEATDDKGATTVLWDGKWSQDMLDVRRAEVGEAIYASEYLNKLSSSHEKVFEIDDKLNEYKVTGGAEGIKKPLSSSETLTYWAQDLTTRVWEKKTCESGPFFDQMFRIMTYDPAKGLSSHHDYSCLAVLGFDNRNTMWVLDMWMGRAKKLVIQRQMWSMGLRWRPKLIGIESISDQIALVDSTQTYMHNQIKETGMVGWTPRIVPVDYRGTAGDKSKPERIATLEWRFPTGCIKYPAHRKDAWPFSMLYSQTSDFTYDLSMLPFDDGIDSVAMGHFVVHNRGQKMILPEPDPTVEQLILKGQYTVGGIPLAGALGSQGMTREVLDSFLDNPTRPVYSGSRVQRRLRHGHTRHRRR